jgi:hypothetical protein
VLVLGEDERQGLLEPVLSAVQVAEGTGGGGERRTVAQVLGQVDRIEQVPLGGWTARWSCPGGLASVHEQRSATRSARDGPP